jgi:3-oxoacyl-[acyl-carrier-protein] synthase-3
MGSIEALSGIRERRVAASDVQCSDLAVEACRRVLAQAKVDVSEVDLLIFASAGQDLAEPATANIVQAKLGTRCPVFDVKNACNSFLNGMQLAESLILGGSCRTALVTVGEVSSRCIAWKTGDVSEFWRNFPGYTVGDAGGAVLLAKATDERGIFFRQFSSISNHWELMTVMGGGSMHPRDEEHTYLRTNGSRLKDVFIELGVPILHQAMQDTGLRFTDFQRIFVHQVSMPYLREMLAATGIPEELVELTVVDLGNMAAASIPVAMAQAMERGAVGPGDRVMCVGLASGISVGIMMIDL